MGEQVEPFDLKWQECDVMKHGTLWQRLSTPASEPSNFSEKHFLFDQNWSAASSIEPKDSLSEEPEWVQSLNFKPSRVFRRTQICPRRYEHSCFPAGPFVIYRLICPISHLWSVRFDSLQCKVCIEEPPKSDPSNMHTLQVSLAVKRFIFSVGLLLVGRWLDVSSLCIIIYNVDNYQHAGWYSTRTN